MVENLYAGRVATGTAMLFAVPLRTPGRATSSGTTLCRCSFGKVWGFTDLIGPRSTVGRVGSNWSIDSQGESN
jgi:hypothetical protein